VVEVQEDRSFLQSVVEQLAEQVVQSEGDKAALEVTVQELQAVSVGVEEYV
jgi:hypothetical protein